MDDVFDSADHPLDGRRWWMKSESPWQTLAACFELTEALRSRDPLSHVSSLAIYQDGSCNGLQHYAAMGRDTIGAHQVIRRSCVLHGLFVGIDKSLKLSFLGFYSGVSRIFIFLGLRECCTIRLIEMTF